MAKPRTPRKERTATERIQFTKRALEALPPTETRRAVYDLEERELGLRIEPNGRKSFFWWRQVNGRPTFKTLGSFPATSVEAARGAARELTGKLDALKRTDYSPHTENPFVGHRGEKTLEGLFDDYIKRQLAGAKNPRRAEENARWLFDSYFSDWKGRKLSQVTRKDVIERHQQIGDDHGQVAANRAIQLLRAVYFFGERMELWAGANPAAKITPFREEKRRRFLNREEMARLGAALKREPNPDLVDYVTLSLVTGARKSDVLSMRWHDLNLRDRQWTIPTPKNSVPYVVGLNEKAVAVLKRRKNGDDTESRFVFPSYGETGHVINLSKRWKHLLIRAGLYEKSSNRPRMHDIRRTLGSWMAARGASLPVIGKALGHSSQAATAIYAQLDLSSVRPSVSRTVDDILAALAKKPKELPAPRPGNG